MLNVSSKTIYTLSALLELAAHKKCLQIKEISDAQGIPENYLRILLADLKRAGFIKSIRGTQGGYLLAKEPSEIFLLDVFRHFSEAADFRKFKLKDGTVIRYLIETQKRLEMNFNGTLEDLLNEKIKSEKNLDYAI